MIDKEKPFRHDAAQTKRLSEGAYLKWQGWRAARVANRAARTRAVNGAQAQ